MTPDRKLPDDDSRTRAVTDLDKNHLVVAGAGTGKTTLLIERILHLLDAGTPCEKIAAITFTEAAAAELRTRLRSSLEQKAVESDDPKWETVLGNLERAQISTIHAFCGKLLRELPVESEVDPGAQVIDPLTSRFVLSRAWRRYLHEETSEPESSWLDLLQDSSLEKLRVLAFQLVDHRDALEDPQIGDPKKILQAFEDRMKHRMQELQTLIGAHARPGVPDAITRWADTLEAWLEEASGDLLSMILLIDSEGRKLPTVSVGAKKTWGEEEEAKAAASALAKAMREELTRFRSFPDDLASHRLASLALAKLSRFWEFYESEKRAAGMLDFQDLLLKTRDLLRGNLPARKRLTGRFDRILVDEFQDTDPLQAEILFFLCDAECLSDDWEQVCLTPGKLFLVGDPKQSIYGWRRADMRVFDTVRALLQKQGGHEGSLSSNFRSSAQVVDFVNGFFSMRMRPKGEEHLQAEYDPIHACRSPESGDAPGPAIHLLGISQAATALPTFRAEEAREHQAHEIARQIESARGSLHVAHASGEHAVAKYSDIAVLARTNSMLQVLEEALQEYGIPYVTQAAGGLFRREEVRDLLLLLRVLDNPLDRISLTGVLRSPIFGLSDLELADLARDGRLQFHQDQSLEFTVEDHVREAFADLNRWHALSQRVSASDLVETLLRESALLPVSATAFDGEQRVANLYKMADLADSYAPAGQPTLGSFLGFLYSIESHDPDETEFALSNEEADAVSLHTMHRAKGLEFPIVFLMGLEHTSSGGSQPPIVRRPFGEDASMLAVRKSPWRSVSWKYVLEEQEKKRLEAESTRLLYVAMTRAKDHLYLCGSFAHHWKKSTWNEICTHMGLTEEDFAEEAPGSPSGSPVPGHEETVVLHMAAPRDRDAVRSSRSIETIFSAPVTSEWRSAMADEEKRSRLRESEAAEMLPLETTVTALDESMLAGDSLPRTNRSSAFGAQSRREFAALVGTLTHAVLEQLPPGIEHGWEKVLERTLRQHYLEEEPEGLEAGQRCRQLLSELFASPFWGELRDSINHWTEVPFLLPCDSGHFVRGRADLVVERGDGSLQIVDWKTDDLRSSNRTAVEAAREHLEQARVYRSALSEATGRTDVGFTFLYLDGCQAVPM